MRISPIHVAQPSIKVSNTLRARNIQEKTNLLQTQAEPSFKGLKAGAWGIAGTFIGGGVAAILSGGALLPVLLASAVGTTSGCIYGSSKEDNSGYDDDYDPCYPNRIDY